MMSGKFFPSSRSRTPLLLCAAAAVAGTGLGWLGRSLREGTPGQNSVRTPELPGKFFPSTPPGGVRMATAAERQAEALTVRLSGDKAVKYWLRLLGASENASAPVLARLVDSLGNEPAALSLLGTRWAQLDAGGMLAALKSRATEKREMSTAHRPAPGSGDLQKILVDEWFRQNPEYLIQALGTTEGIYGLNPAKNQLLSRLASTDPEQALKLTIAWRVRLKAEDSTALISWVRANAGKAMGLLLASDVYYPNFGDAGEIILNEVGKALAAHNPAGSLARLSDFGQGSQQYLAQRIVKEWAKLDLKAAVEWLSGGNLNPLNSTEMTKPLLEVWGATDPAAALTWANSHLTGGAKRDAATALVETIARQDPGKAVEFINQLDPGNSKEEAMRTLSRLSVKNKEKPELMAAFQWMMAMPDPAMRGIAMDCGGRAILDAAPEEVMSYLNGPSGGDAPLSLLSQAGRVMSHQDGAAAMQWAAGLRPDAVSQVRLSVLSSWFHRDAAGAEAWVRELPAGDERLVHVTEVTRAVASQKGEEAVNVWLETLPASDHAAIRKGLDNVWQLDPAAKARLEAKYR